MDKTTSLSCHGGIDQRHALATAYVGGSGTIQRINFRAPDNTAGAL